MIEDKLTIDNVKTIVYDYPTKHDIGFTRAEQKELILKYGIDSDQYFEKLGINTVAVIETEVVTYHHDILKALTCVLEDREQTSEEWD